MNQASGRLVVAVCATVVLLAGSGEVRAQGATGQTFGLQLFRPAVDSKGYITVNASQVLGHNDISFGLGALDWGYRLLRFEADGGRTYSIDNVVVATLIAAYGLKLGPVELEIGGSLPLGIMTGNRDPDSLGNPGPNDDKDLTFDGQGLGNAGLHLKTRFLKTSRGPKIGLGVIASLYFPTAAKDSWLGESKLVPQITGILDKEFGRERRFRASINAGIRLRPETESFVDSDTTDGAMPTGGKMAAHAEVPFGLGLASLDFSPKAHRFLARPGRLEPRRQILATHLGRIHQNRGALHEIPQLAHVSGPVVLLEQRARLVREPLRRLALAGAEVLEEMRGEQRHVGGPFAERRDVNR